MTVLHERSLYVDDAVVERGNSFGHIALWTMSFFLLAVSRHTPILTDHNKLNALHIWPGRIVVVCAICHGVVHLYRWSVVLNLSVVSMMIPSRKCWMMGGGVDEQDDCMDPVTGCSCYHTWRNLAGFLAMVGMAVIGLTSLYKIRRRWYRFFYLVHATAAPITMLLLCLHFTRSLIYMAPSILYYMACSFPVLAETIKKWNKGVRITSCRRISHDCFSLTLEATNEAMQQYRPGQHIMLRVPSISLVSHPFTVNRVLGDGHSLCIMIRETGDFTKSLASALLDSTTESFPKIQLDGYYGSTQRLEQTLQYDTVVLIAGGIGIVSYLSLLHDMLTFQNDKSPRVVKLHWTCRDAALVRFITRQYLDKLAQQASQAQVPFEVTIYLTSDETLVESNDPDKTASLHYSDDNTIPFSPSRFSILRYRGFGKIGSFVTRAYNHVVGGLVSYYVCRNALKEEDFAATVWMYVCVAGMWMYTISVARTMDSGYFSMFASVVWLGLFIIWYLYLNVQDENSKILQRLWSPLAITILAVLVAIFCTFRSNDLITAKYKQVEQIAEAVDAGIELEDFVKNAGDDQSRASGLTGLSSNGIRMEQGRPSIFNLLASSIAGDATENTVGVFACGPVSLMEDVRSSVSLLRHGCYCSRQRRIELYEETFEM